MKKSIKTNKYEVIIYIIDSKSFFINNIEKTVLILNLLVNKDFFYENYNIIINKKENLYNDILIEKIIDNMHDITFKYDKFIGEVLIKDNDILLVHNKDVSDMFKIKSKIEEIYKEYKTVKNKSEVLKYEAFFEMYFHTHSVPLKLLKKELNIKTNLFNLEQYETSFKNKFKCKVQELSLKLGKLEDTLELYDRNNYGNKVTICEKYLYEVKRLNNKYKKYIQLKKQLDEYKGLKKIISFRKYYKLNKKIKYIESKFNYDEEYKELLKKIMDKTGKDIMKSRNIKIETLLYRLEQYIGNLEQEICKNSTLNTKVKKQINILYFDDIYNKLGGNDEK